jgi:hypothetical protein
VCVYIYISYTQGPAAGRAGTRPAPGPGFANYREKMAWERAQAAGGAGGNGGSGGAGREWVSAGGGGGPGGGGGIGYAQRMAKQVNPRSLNPQPSTLNPKP